MKKMERKDHVFAMVKASTEMIPILGGPLSSLMADYLPNGTNRVLKESLLQLEEKLDNLNERLDYEQIKQSEFHEIFKSSYYTITRTHQKEKIDAATTLIANMLLKNTDKEKLTFVEADHFSRCIEQLSVGALKVLAATVVITKRNNPDLKEKLTMKFKGGYSFDFSLLFEELPEYEPSLLMGLVGELDSFNLLHKKGFPEIPTPDYGNYPIELSNLGIKFVYSVIDVDFKL